MYPYTDKYLLNHMNKNYQIVVSYSNTNYLPILLKVHDPDKSIIKFLQPYLNNLDYYHISERTLPKITEAKSRVLRYRRVPLFDVNPIEISESAVGKELNEIVNNFHEYLRKRKKYGTKVLIKELKMFTTKLLKQLVKIKRLQEQNSKS